MNQGSIFLICHPLPRLFFYFLAIDAKDDDICTCNNIADMYTQPWAPNATTETMHHRESGHEKASPGLERPGGLR